MRLGGGLTWELAGLHYSTARWKDYFPLTTYNPSEYATWTPVVLRAEKAQGPPAYLWDSIGRHPGIQPPVDGLTI